MMGQPLVSIVMPAYNAEAFIAQAVRSVLAQSYPNWELLVVDDGSEDGTASVLDGFSDPRIRRFRQVNKGIGPARNFGLSNVQGEFLAFLDSDDILPPQSIESRVRVLLENPEVDIVDGMVQVMDRSLNTTLRIHRPTFQGEPLHDLVTMRGGTFFGPSWMLRWPRTMTLRFVEGVSHAEDLCFFIHYARRRQYRTTNEKVLLYRVTGTSSMSDLTGLDRTYQQLAAWLLRDRRHATFGEALVFLWRSRKAMFGTYWSDRRLLDMLGTYSSGVLGILRYLDPASNPFQASSKPVDIVTEVVKP